MERKLTFLEGEKEKANQAFKSMIDALKGEDQFIKAEYHDFIFNKKDIVEVFLYTNIRDVEDGIEIIKKKFLFMEFSFKKIKYKKETKYIIHLEFRDQCND